MTEKKKTVKREYAFDILRVIAMIMVITVHVSNVYSRSFGIISNNAFLVSLVFNTISRISVPIFLMISGALLLDREFNKEKYLKRLIKFIILIIVWDIVYLICWLKCFFYSVSEKFKFFRYCKHLYFSLSSNKYIVQSRSFRSAHWRLFTNSASAKD